MTDIIHFACGPQPNDKTPEDWMLVGLVDDGSSQREAMEDIDRAERLLCDCCHERLPTAANLTASGDEVLCDGCIGLFDTAESELNRIRWEDPEVCRTCGDSGADNHECEVCREHVFELRFGVRCG